MGAELLEDERRHPISCAVCGVYDNTHTVERKIVWKGLLEENDISPACVFQFFGTPDSRPGGSLSKQTVVVDEILDLALGSIRQFETIGPEDLDAVVLIRIVASADDDARVRAHAHGQVRDGGGRHRSG